jgi:hypothetical protein
VRGVMITTETVVQRRGGPLTADIDGELVLLDAEQGIYFALDAIGHRIWLLLEEPCAVDALCGRLCEEFDVSAETCRTDVLAFLHRLTETGLLEVR